MNKKTKIIIISSIIAIVVVAIIIALTINHVDQEKANYFFENQVAKNILAADNLGDEKPVLIFFYAPICKSCHQFMPIYKQITKDYQKDYNFAMLNTQDPATYPLTVGNVFTIPSLFIFDPKIGNKVCINIQAIRTYGELRGELDRYIRIRSAIDIEKAEKIHHEFIASVEKKMKAKQKKNK